MSKTDGVSFVSKITTRTLGITMDTVREKCKKEPVKLFQAYGEINGVEHGDGDLGPWVKFKGAIECVNCLDGSISRSGSLFLPPTITSMLEVQFAKLKEESEGPVLMKVAFEVGAKKSDVPIGYEYTTRSMLPEDAVTDSLIEIRTMLQGQLALPKKSSEKKAA